MRIWLALLPAALLLSGCSEESATVGSVPAPTMKATLDRAPKFEITGPPLAIVNATGADVTIGLGRLDALKVFPKPEVASLISDLPPALRGQTGFTAQSWQLGGEGFGVVLYDDRVCVAEHQTDKVTEDQLKGLLAACSKKNGPFYTQSAGRFVRYYFWQSGTQRVMICALENPDSSWNVTQAIGDSGDPNVPNDSGVMDTLGMSTGQANLDRDRADATLEEFFQKGNKTMPARPSAMPTPLPSPSPSATPS